MKVCTKCGQTKPKTEFSKKTSKRDGLKASCKACDKEYHAAYYAANADLIKANVAKYQSSNIDKRNAYLAEYCSLNRDRIKATKAEYYLANQEKMSARRAAYYAANAEKIKASCAKYSAANPEKSKAATAAWRAANPDAVRVYSHNRRARERAAGGKLSPDLAARLFKIQRGKCACCGVSIEDGNHMDHVIPVALGGPNEDWNIQLLCAPCNLSKGAKHPVEFMQQRGFLL